MRKYGLRSLSNSSLCASVSAVVDFSLRTLAPLALIVFLVGCAKAPSSGDPTRGQDLFQRGCAVCHNATAEKKIGPGLLGLYKKKTLPDGAPVNDTNVETWIRQGGGLMPGFKNALTPEQMRDLLAYLKGL